MSSPVSLWDLSLWAAVTAIILLTTSELVSPYYAKAGIVIDRKRLRIMALLMALMFLFLVGHQILQLIVGP